ncbi:MAG: hypothetical protein B6243_12535 [Anaerolineaceae bacterium 4572_5.2]|nr:MAG: hypothetical protein B6243_12535 [Anaerolineaceae bacterium 4572_5.2]
MTNDQGQMTKQIPRWLKQLLMIGGLLAAIPGALVATGFLCGGLVAVVDGADDFVGPAIALLLAAIALLGGGGALFLHGMRSAGGKASTPMRLWPVWALFGLFGLALAIGLFVEDTFAAALIFPPALIAAAALPPLAAVSWFSRRQTKGFTWRRASLAFTGGGTVGVFVAIALEILLPLFVVALAFSVPGLVMDRLEDLLDALAGEDLSSAVTSGGFIYLMVQVAIIAPLAEEIAKPLAILPLANRLSRRQAFLVGAMAGAGFAALENIMYAGFGFAFWAGILAIRAPGAAIHPLGAGLMTLAWRDVMRREPGAWRGWVARFGLAAGMHALWNGGSLLVLTLAGAKFFGPEPAEIDVPGLSAGGTTLALLLILGLLALWLGRATAQQLLAGEEPLKLRPTEFEISDRAMAIWGLACLVAIVPAGIAGLQLVVW